MKEFEKVYDKYPKLKEYAQPELTNYIIPVNVFEDVKDEVYKLLKDYTQEYFLMFLSKDNGYEEDYWCITNWLE